MLRFIFVISALLLSPAMAQQDIGPRYKALDDNLYVLQKMETQMQNGMGDYKITVAAIKGIATTLYPAQPFDIKIDPAKLAPDPAGHNENASMWRQQIWPQVGPLIQKVKDEMTVIKGKK